MLHTRLCDLLGIEFPILSAPMGPDVCGPELVAAVSNAGGLGLMQAQFHPPPLLRQAIRRVRQLMVEFHHHCTDRTLQDTLDCIAAVQASGFALMHTEDRNCVLLRKD